MWLAGNSVTAAFALVAVATSLPAAIADMVLYYSGKEGVGFLGVIVCCWASLCNLSSRVSYLDPIVLCSLSSIVS